MQSAKGSFYVPTFKPADVNQNSFIHWGKEDSRYGNISVQKIGDPTSTSVRTLNLCSFQGVQYKLKYISAYKNLGYLKPFALGFMSLALFVFVWEQFEKKFPKITTGELAKI